jgi:outer membrane protein, heavy metal efflux system
MSGVRLHNGLLGKLLPMRFRWAIVVLGVLACGLAATEAAAQTPLTWAQVRARFEMNNPTLRAGQLTIDESRADEVTAYLRPNPDLSLGGVQWNIAGIPEDSDLGHFQNLTTSVSIGYLWERNHKRALRRDSAVGATAIATSTQADLVRTLTFNLRAAFVQLLQAKAFVTLAQQNLTDYDQVLSVSGDRFRAGDIAQIDLDRLQLQRVQYESDVQTALVNVRTSKIQLLALMNDRMTPVNQFDVNGSYDFAPTAPPLEQVRQTALQNRPDLRAAVQGIDKAKIDNRLAIANGSTDPSFGGTYAWPTSDNTVHSLSVGVDIPLRIFDRNQGEKRKTLIDITRNEQLADANRTQVTSDVDSAYATMMSNVTLLQPYKDTYLAQSTRVRDTMTFSYQSGGASLIDFLQAQQDYRSVQIAYVNLVAAYLNAAAQLNLAVGQEVIP